jgi:hypothetical protein
VFPAWEAEGVKKSLHKVHGEVGEHEEGQEELAEKVLHHPPDA